MRMVTCNNGHYYDQEKNANCPYCSNAGSMSINQNNGSNAGIQEEKTAFYGNDESEKTALYQNPAADDERTVFHSSSAASSEPEAFEKQEEVIVENKGPILLSGWLAVVSEEGRGTSYTLTFGMNTIGRSGANHVNIKNGDSSISREKHALIIYDYDNNIFYIKHGDGQFLSYLNSEVLLETKQLKANDRIKLGSTELIFIPLCSNEFNWKD